MLTAPWHTKRIIALSPRGGPCPCRWENSTYSYSSDWSYSYGYGDDNGEEPYDALDVASFDVVLAPGLLYVLWGFCDAVVQVLLPLISD